MAQARRGRAEGERIAQGGCQARADRGAAELRGALEDAEEKTAAEQAAVRHAETGRAEALAAARPCRLCAGARGSWSRPTHALCGAACIEIVASLCF